MSASDTPRTQRMIDYCAARQMNRGSHPISEVFDEMMRMEGELTAANAKLAEQRDQYRVLEDEMLLIHTRYETIRRMSPSQFAEVFRANTEQNIPFDDLIDNAAISAARWKS